MLQQGLMTYHSKFMNYLHKSELEIDRKVLADIAVNNPEKFSIL